MPAPPPRLHVLMRRESDRAVVIRQGPTKVFCTIGWDLTSDEFAVGQWCKHKIYPTASDISPDGTWMTYFALSGRWSAETLGAWRAISRAPYLKAVQLLPHGDTWCIDLYRHRLQREGWLHLDPDQPAPAGPIYVKRINESLTLRKHLDRWRTAREWHQLQTAEGSVHERRGWGWAELDQRRDRIVWAEDGVIYEARVEADGLGVPRQLFDSRGMTFANLRAPYDDVVEVPPFWS